MGWVFPSYLFEIIIPLSVFEVALPHKARECGTHRQAGQHQELPRRYFLALLDGQLLDERLATLDAVVAVALAARHVVFLAVLVVLLARTGLVVAGEATRTSSTSHRG
jgi:hypothetical protein